MPGRDTSRVCVLLSASGGTLLAVELSSRDFLGVALAMVLVSSAAAFRLRIGLTATLCCVLSCLVPLASGSVLTASVSSAGGGGGIPPSALSAAGARSLGRCFLRFPVSFLYSFNNCRAKEGCRNVNRGGKRGPILGTFGFAPPERLPPPRCCCVERLLLSLLCRLSLASLSLSLPSKDPERCFFPPPEPGRSAIGEAASNTSASSNVSTKSRRALT